MKLELNREALMNEIPQTTAQSAFYALSHSPEKRGEQCRQSFADTLISDYQNLSELAGTDDKIMALNEAFQRYRMGYKALTMKYLHSQSRCASSFIVGPANFPVRQQEKRRAVADKRQTELVEYREKALRAIRRQLTPECGPIMSGDDNAIDRLKAKIEEAEKHQTNMKATNEAWRLYDKKKDPSRLLALGYTQAQIDRLAAEIEKAYSWEKQPFPTYRLTNNNANIRRLKDRLAGITKAHAAPEQKIEGSAARLEDCPKDNRVRLFFPGKPDAEIRNGLKRHGFRWSPTIGAWQAYRNSRSIEHARVVAGIEA